MPKPKRASASDIQNPLSSARKDSASSVKKNSNKADRNAQGLWHRKCGAGYHLFLSYYGSQPCGVVAGDDDFISFTTTHESTDLVSSKSNHDGSLGMSRAAKRRRQRKNSCPGKEVEALHEQYNSGRGHSVGETSIGCKTSGTASQTIQSFESTHPLIQAYSSTNNKYPHLTRFVHALSRPLPLTLRFRYYDQSSFEKVKNILWKDYSDSIAPVSYDPTNSIYQSTSNSSLHKSNLTTTHPKLKQLIVDSSMNGTIARQELGSMLPVICLHSVRAITVGSKVLDICASPGSKTLQVLEIVGGSSDGRKGRVIANDVHSGRLDSLRAAVLRSGLPESLTSRVTYTNYDASVFPAPKSGKLFDAIVCDVPCGGDGTIRKDKHILPMWSPNISNSMHCLQLKILGRALELVKVGGVVCYSTCSLNPIEDEAVVAAALRGSTDTDTLYELLDWPHRSLPGFSLRPGVHTWKVAFYGQGDKDSDDNDDFEHLSFFDDYVKAVETGIKEASPTFWPNKAENERIRLGRCTRLFPQDQDSGGFFLALIKRIR